MFFFLIKNPKLACPQAVSLLSVGSHVDDTNFWPKKIQCAMQIYSKQFEKKIEQFEDILENGFFLPDNLELTMKKEKRIERKKREIRYDNKRKKKAQ